MRFSYNLFNSLAIGVAMWLSALTLGPMLADTHYMTWVPAVVGVPAIVGALGAALRLPRLLTLAAQTVGMVVLLGWLALQFTETLPTAGPGILGRIDLLTDTGAAAVLNGSLPLPSEPGLTWLILAVIALMLLATELLVNGLEQPAWSIAPLIVAYAIGALVIGSREMNWLHFAAVAAGYLLILLASTGFGNGHRPGQRGLLASFHTSRAVIALVIAVVAALVALLVTPALPQGPKQPWLQASSNSPIQLSDPTVALNENLKRPEDTDVLTYTTSSGEPVYLRLVALTQFTSNGVQLVPMELATGGLDNASQQPGTRVTTTIDMAFRSEFLPAPFAAERFSADGRWAYDPNTLSIVSTGPDRLAQTEALNYEVISDLPTPTRDDLLNAEAGIDPAGDETLKVPTGLDPLVETETTRVVESAGAATAGAKALAIQAYLRSDAFTYSLEAPEEDGLSAISAFLLTDKTGYCIHFASAMMTMARIEGIPARMAIGFAPGEATGNGSFKVTTHNMHAWPELYFEDLGWVPFEPTRSVADAPAWTDPDSGPLTPTATPTPTGTNTAAPTPVPEPTISMTPQTPTTETDDGIPSGWLILIGALLLAAVPFAVRTLQRAWRLRAGQPPAQLADSAWDEVEATWRDFGLDWDTHSPRVAAESLAKDLSPQSAAELETIALTVERIRYSRGGADTSSLAHEVRALRRNLVKTQPGDRQVRAVLLPASLVPRGTFGG